MAKSKAAKPTDTKKKPAGGSPGPSLRGRILLHACAAFILLAAVAIGLWRLNRYVDKDLVYTNAAPAVVLKDPPAWMSPELVRQITDKVKPRVAYSAFDQRVLATVAEVLNSDAEIHPWVKHVNQIRRVYGNAPGDTIEVDCEFRAPVALVEWGQYFWYVDHDGFKLPDQFTAAQLPKVMMGSDGKLNLRIIGGVKRPPPRSGEKWAGEDLTEGIGLLELLANQPFAEEIVKVDVTNADGRIDRRDPYLVLWTNHNTRILWGRSVDARDFFAEITPAKKLDHLAQMFAQFHRVDANHSQVDLRFEDVYFPSAEAPEAPQQNANSSGP